MRTAREADNRYNHAMGQISNYLPLIIGLLYLVIHIASLIAKEAQKRKEREQRRLEAERRRMMEAGFPAPVDVRPEPQIAVDPMLTPRQPVPPIGPGSARGRYQGPAPVPGRMSRAEELAQRRKEQLELLRARREPNAQPVRQGRVPSPVAGTTAPESRASGATPPQVRGGRFGLEPSQTQREAQRDRQRKDREQERDRRAREEARQRAERQSRAQKQRELQQRVARLSNAATAAPLTVEMQPQERSTDRDVLSPHHRPNPALQRLQQRLRDKATLRDLIVMREVLDPPLALRS